MPGRFEKLLAILEDPQRWPEHEIYTTLESCRGYLLALFAPPRSVEERKAVQSGRAVVDERNVDLPDDVKQEVLYLAEELDVSEFLCASILADTLHEVRKPNYTSNAENAIAFYHAERAECLRCLKLMLEGVLTPTSPLQSLAVILDDFIVSLVQQHPNAFGQTIITQINYGNTAVQKQRTRQRTTQTTFQTAFVSMAQPAASHKLSPALLEESTKWLARERRELGYILFALATFSSLAPEEVVEVIKWLRNCEPHDELVVYIFSAFSAALNVGAAMSLDPPSNRLYDSNAILKDLHQVLGSEWKIPQLRATASFLWALFLMHGPKEPTLVERLGLSEQDPEQLIQQAIRQDAFQYMISLLVSCRPPAFFDEDSAMLQEVMIDGASVPPIEVDFHLYALKQFDDLIINFLNSVPTSFLRRLRHGEEDVDSAKFHASRASKTVQEGQQPRHDVEALLRVISVIYTDSQPDAGMVYWQDPDSKLSSFVRWSAETQAPALLTANFQMLASLARGSQCSEHVHGFLSARSRTSSAITSTPICSWSGIISALSHYNSTMYTAQNATGASHGPSSDGSMLSHDDIQYLWAVLRLVKNVVRFSPVARASLSSKQIGTVNLVNSLSFLVSQLDLKAQFFDTLAAFCVGDDPGTAENARQTWTRLENGNLIPYTASGAVLPYSTSSDTLWRSTSQALPTTNHEGLVRDLEEVEASNMVYPSTVSFIRLLSALIHVPSNSITLRRRIPYQTVPENVPSDRDHRTKGIDAFIRFVLDDVFHKIGSRRYKDAAEQWKVVEACLGFMEKCLASYDLQGLLSPGILESQADMRTKKVLTSLVVHPGFEVMRRFCLDDRLSKSLFEVLIEGAKYLEASEVPTPPAEMSVKRALRILYRVLDIQKIYLEVLLPILGGSDIHGMLKASGVNLVFSPLTLDQLLLRNQDALIHIALLVGRYEDEEVVYLAVKSLSLLSQSPAFGSLDQPYSVDGGRGRATRLAGWLDASEYSLRIIDSFANLLMRDTADDADVEEDVNDLLRDASSTSETPPLIQAIRSAVLDLLLLNTVPGRPAPNVAHFLLGFNLQDGVQAESVSSPALAVQIPCLQVILELLFEGIPRVGERPSGVIPFCSTYPVLAEKCYRIIHQLSTHDWTSSAVLRYLRTEYNFTVRQLLYVPMRPGPLIRTSGNVRYPDGTVLPLTCPALTAFLGLRSLLLEMAALELHILVESRQFKRAQDVVSVIYGGDVMNGNEDADLQDSSIEDISFQQQSGKALELLRNFDVTWYDDFDGGKEAPLYYTEAEIQSCLRLDDTGCPIYDSQEVLALISVVRRRLEQQVLLSDSVQKANFDRDTRNLLIRVVKENNWRKVEQAKAQGLSSWRRLVEVALGPTFELLPENLSESAVLELLHFLPGRISGPEASSYASEELAEVILSLITRLREARQQDSISSSIKDPTWRRLPVEALGHILQSIVQAIPTPGTSDAIRGNLCSAVINCLHVFSSDAAAEPTVLPWPESLHGRSTTDTKVSSTLTGIRNAQWITLLQYVDSSLDRLVMRVNRDASAGSDVWQTIAFTLLEVLVSLSSGSDRDVGSIIVQQGFLRNFVQSLKGGEEDLFKALSVDADSLTSIYVYEAKLGLLLSLAKTQAGAQSLLDSQLFGTLGQCEFIQAMPQDDDASMDYDSFLPSATERYHQLLLPALQLAVRVPFAFSSPSTALRREVYDFMAVHRDVLLLLLRPEMVLTLTLLREFNLLLSLATTALFIVTPEDLKSQSGFGAFHSSILALVNRSMSQSWLEVTATSNATDRAEDAQLVPVYGKHITVFKEKVQGALSQLHENCLLYLSSVVELQGFTPVLTPSKVVPLQVSTVARIAASMPHLGALLRILQATLGSLVSSVVFVGQLEKDLQAVGELTDSEISELLRLVGVDASDNVDDTVKERLALEALQKSYTWARNDYYARLRTAEMLLFLAYRHLAVYVHWPESSERQDSIKAITQVVGNWDPNEVRSLARRELNPLERLVEDLQMTIDTLGEDRRPDIHYLVVLFKQCKDALSDQRELNGAVTTFGI